MRKSFGESVKNKRESLGLSVAEFARHARVSLPTMLRVEKGATVEAHIWDKVAQVYTSVQPSGRPPIVADLILKHVYMPRAFQDTEKSELILRLRFGLEEPGKRFTLDEIGARFGVSRERIRQIQAKYKVLFPARYRELEAQAPPKPVSVNSVTMEHRRQRKAVLKMAQKKTLTVQGLSAANVPLEGLSEQSSERYIFEAMHRRFRLTDYGEFVWCSIGKHTVNVSEMPNGKYKHTPKTRVCTACNTKRMRKTWAEHREERLAYSREYQKRPHVKAYQREWNKKHWASMTPEERREKRRQHYLKYREALAAASTPSAA